MNNVLFPYRLQRWPGEGENSSYCIKGIDIGSEDRVAISTFVFLMLFISEQHSFIHACTLMFPTLLFYSNSRLFYSAGT